MKSRIRAAVAAAALAGVCAVGAGSAQAYTLPPAGGQFDYQIGGAYTPDPAVRVVSRDRTAAPVTGKYNVCYVNAFQTQPAEVDWWRANYPTLLLRDSRGRYVVDGEWNEILLDTRTRAKRTTLVTILTAWIDRCKADGFQAIEPDNLDSWYRSDDPNLPGEEDYLLTPANNLAVMRAMATAAHSATVGTDRSGVAIAQKNTGEIAYELREEYGYDFVIAEECQLWGGEFGRECDDFLEYYGNLVYEIEYTDNEPFYPGEDPDYPRGGTGSFYDDACSARGADISVILRDRQVTPAGHVDYHYEAC